MFKKESLKWIMMALLTVVFTACGGSGSSEDTPTLQESAIEKFISYATNGTPIPTIQNYIDAGVIGVSESNLADINEVVSNLTQEEVDTKEEIQALLNALGLSTVEPIPTRTTSIPTPSSTPTRTTTPTPTPTPVADTTPPVILIVGGASTNVVQFSTYTDAGASATDDVDASVTVTPTGTVDTDTVGVYDINYTATDTAGNSATETRTVTVIAFSITHNTTTYGAVRSPYTDEVWLDRNLGAAQVCTAFDDTACYGDYYQWGRNHDGHQRDDTTISTTITQATDVNSAGIEFIIKSSDWASVDSSGATRTTNWSDIEGSSVCPERFRVPTLAELKLETLDNGVTNSNTAFSNFLKLPSSGYRYRFGATLNAQGSSGYVWTSSAVGSSSHIVYFYSGGAYSDSFNRATGLSVRCLRD